jgi:hypothetical protein
MKHEASRAGGFVPGSARDGSDERLSNLILSKTHEPCQRVEVSLALGFDDGIMSGFVRGERHGGM